MRTEAFKKDNASKDARTSPDHDQGIYSTSLEPPAYGISMIDDKSCPTAASRHDTPGSRQHAITHPVSTSAFSLQKDASLEQEADLVAESIIHTPLTTHREFASSPNSQPHPDTQHASHIQTKHQSDTTQSDTTVDIPPELDAELQMLPGGGQPLTKGHRAFFESRMHTDFQSVRVHTDQRAARLARQINAKAFTLGQDVVFAAGQYQPDNREGKQLIAHELTHVIQQNNTPMNPQIQRHRDKATESTSIRGLAPPNTAKENQADQVALSFSHSSTSIPSTMIGNHETVTPAIPTSASSALHAAHDTLPSPLQSQLESSLGENLSAVRINKSHDSASAMNATAYTQNQSIVFAPGAYDPQSPSGKALIAHEVAHTLYHNDGMLHRTPGGGVDHIEIVMDRGIIIFYQNNQPYVYNLRNRNPSIIGRTLNVRINRRRNWLDVHIEGTPIEFYLDNAQHQGNPFTLFRESDTHVTVIVWGATETQGQPGSSGGGAGEGGAGGEGRGHGGMGPGAGEAERERPGSGAGPSQPPERQRGVRITPSASDADREIVRRLLLRLHGNNEDPDAPVLDTYITMADIRAFRELFLLPENEQQAVIDMLRSSRGNTPNGDINYASIIETTMELRELNTFGDTYDFHFQSSGSESGPLVRRPVHGEIVSHDENLVPDKEGIFEFQVHDPVDLFAVPHVFIRWFAARRNTENPSAEPDIIERETTNYIEVNEDSLINDRQFEVDFDAVGSYEIHAFVAHSFFYPAHFSKVVEVRTEAERLAAMESAEKVPFGEVAPGEQEHVFGDVRTENAIVRGTITTMLTAGNPITVPLVLLQDDEDAVGIQRTGTLSSAQMNVEAQVAYLNEQINNLNQYLTRVRREEQEDLIAWGENRLQQLTDLRERLRTNLRNQHPVNVDGFYVSDRTGVRSGHMRLASWFTYDAASQRFNVTLIDYSQMVRNTDFTFEESGRNLQRTYEYIFFLLSSTYPGGRMRFSFQQYQGLTPQRTFIQYERVTDTLLNDIQETVFSQPVSIIVNVAAAVLTVFPPTAPIGIGISLVYNGADTALNFMDAARSGTVTSSNYVDLGMVALDILPLVGKAARLGKTSLRVLRVGTELVELAGNFYVFTAQALQQIQEIRTGDVQRLAELQADLGMLVTHHGPPNEMARINREIQRLQSSIRARSIQVFSEMALQQGLQILSQRGAAHLAEQSRLRFTGVDLPEGSHPHPDIDTETRQRLEEAEGDTPRPDVEPTHLVRRPAESSTRVRATDPELSMGLPADLRHIPVTRVAGEHNSVRIIPEYGPFGIRGFRLEAGQRATVGNVQAHVVAIRYLQRYQGLSGAIRSAAEYAMGIITGLPPDAVRRVRELHGEILKLPDDIKARVGELEAQRSQLTDEQAAIHERQIQGLQEQLERHRLELAGIHGGSRSVGFVAAIDSVFEGMGRDISRTMNPQQIAPARTRQSIARQILVKFITLGEGLVDAGSTPQASTMSSIRARIRALIMDPVFGDLALRELNDAVGPDNVRIRRRERIPVEQYMQRLLLKLNAVDERRRNRNESEGTAEEAIGAHRARTDVPDAGAESAGTVSAGVLLMNDASGNHLEQAGGVILGASPAAATPDVSVDTRYRRRRQSGDTETFALAIDHAEQTVLGRAARRIESLLAGRDKQAVTGELRMHVEQRPCFNCLSGLPDQHAGEGPFYQFSTEFPGFRIVVTYGEGAGSGRLVIQNGLIIDE